MQQASLIKVTLLSVYTQAYIQAALSGKLTLATQQPNFQVKMHPKLNFLGGGGGGLRTHTPLWELKTLLEP